MRRIFLTAILSITLLVLVLVAGLSLLLSNIDLNRVKPQIQQWVYQQSGIALAIDGSIDWVIEWQGLPSVSLSMTQLRGYLNTPLETLAQPNHNALADIQQLTLGVMLGELIHGRIYVNQLKANDVSIRLVRNKQGKANWQDIVTQANNESLINKNTNFANDSILAVANNIIINELQLNNIHLDYQDQTSGMHHSINIKSLNSQNLNVQGQSFSIATQATIQNANKNILAISLNSQLSLKGFLQKVKNHSPQIILSDIRAELKNTTPANKGNVLQAAAIKGNASYRLNDHAFTLDNFRLKNAASEINLTINGVPSIHEKNPSLTMTGNIQLTSKRLKAQLNALGVETTTANNVLRKLSINAEISGLYKPLSQRFSLAEIKAEIDDSHIGGAISVLLQNKKVPAISALLNIDQFNIDKYQDTPTKQKNINSNVNTQAARGHQLPLEYLDFADVLLTINIDNLTAYQLDLSSLAAGLEITDGDIKQAILKGTFYQSAINGSAQLHRSNTTATKIKLNQKMTGLDVAALLTAVNRSSADSSQSPTAISGIANIDASLQLEGSSLDAWLNSLSGKTHITLTDGVYASDNIEHRVCQAVASVRKTRLQKKWPSDTVLENISSTIKWHNGIGHLTILKGGLKNIDLSGKGSVDLSSQYYHLDLDAIIRGAIVNDSIDTLSVRHDSHSDPACAINKKYRDIAWPILCRGTLNITHSNTESFDNSCEVNQQRLRGLVRKAVKKEARNKIKKVIDNNIDKHLGDNIEDGLSDLIKGGLEGLFK